MNQDSVTTMDFGKLHICVRSIFSDTSTETVVDKVRKLILQHASDPQLSERQLAIDEDKSEYPT